MKKQKSTRGKRAAKAATAKTNTVSASKLAADEVCMSVAECEAYATQTYCPTLYYGLGAKAAALLVVKLTSAGAMQVFAGDSPLSNKPAGGNLKTERYTTDTYTLQNSADVKFTLKLSALNSKAPSNDPDALRKTGNLTVEALEWPRPYDVNRAHLLGYLDPFGGDINYANYGGVDRDGDIPPNRTFECTFHYVKAAPSATPPVKGEATLTLTDVDSGGTSTETIDLTKLDDTSAGKAGAILIAVRVAGINYEDGCATLEFNKANMDGATPLTFSGKTRGGAAFSGYRQFHLNETTDQP